MGRTSNAPLWERIGGSLEVLSVLCDASVRADAIGKIEMYCRKLCRLSIRDTEKQNNHEVSKLAASYGEQL